MSKGHKRVTSTSNNSLVRRGSSGAILVNKTKEYALQVAQTSAQDEHRIYEGQSYLLALLENIASNIILTEGLPEQWRGARLKVIYRDSPELEQMDKRLVAACYQLKGANTDFVKKYPTVLPNVLARKIDVDTQLILIANDFADAIRELLDTPTGSESGSTLATVLKKYGGDTFLGKLHDIRVNTPKIGRETGVDEVTRLIGENAVTQAEKWGHQWALIGKRHYTDLVSKEKLNEVERKTITRYRKDGYKDSNGEWHWYSKLADTVRNAWKAVNVVQ